MLLATVGITTKVLSVAIGPLLASWANRSLMHQAMVDEAEVL